MKQNTSLRSDQIKIFMWIRNPTRYENTGEQTGWEIIYMDALFLWCIVTDEAFSIILVTIFDSIHHIYNEILKYYYMCMKCDFPSFWTPESNKTNAMKRLVLNESGL